MIKVNLKKFFSLILCVSFKVHAETTNVLKLSCEYDPNSIKNNQY